MLLNVKICSGDGELDLYVPLRTKLQVLNEGMVKYVFQSFFYFIIHEHLQTENSKGEDSTRQNHGQRHIGNIFGGISLLKF